LIVHPTYIRGGVLSWVCDNYLIEAGGAANGFTPFPKSSPSSADLTVACNHNAGGPNVRFPR
jgi:hypothetical protein